MLHRNESMTASFQLVSLCCTVRRDVQIGIICRTPPFVQALVGAHRAGPTGVAVASLTGGAVHGDDAYLFTWRGTRATETIRLALTTCGIRTEIDAQGLRAPNCRAASLASALACCVLPSQVRSNWQRKSRPCVGRCTTITCQMPCSAMPLLDRPRHDRARCVPSGRRPRKLNPSF